MKKNITSRLKNKVQVYGRTPETNALGETDAKETLLATLWCDIVPKSGKVVEIPNAASQYGVITHEVTFRRSALQYLKPEYHLQYGTERLDIEYILPNYNNPDIVIVYCHEVVGL